MVKTERMVAEDVERAPSRAWLVGVAGWFIPGLGHLMVGRWVRALLMGGAAWLCFFLGMAMGGRLYAFVFEGLWSSILVSIPPAIANLGIGAPYIVSWVLDYGFADDPQKAALATYEYGNTFLLIAGLLNYLNMLDAFDIAAGRKS